MNKEIGILTFHYADNHGAVLQAYALRRVINSFLGCHADLINYVPKGYNYPVSPELADSQKKKREKFERFLLEYCGVNTPMIHSVEGNSKDVYVVGSDQIWNLDIWEAAADCEYFLPHLSSKAKRIAYSASIGMEPEEMDEELFRQYLPRFDKISLREENCVERVSRLSGQKCHVTLDPSLLLTGEDYEPLMEKPDRAQEPYLLYFWYDLGDGGLGSVETVNTLARKYNVTIKHSFLSESSLARRMLVRDGGSMIQEGIGEFLWYVKNAMAVVTNSFHGAVFSILFERPLYLYYPQIRKCRQENLVRLLHLQDRVIEGYVSGDRLTLQTDYKPVFHRLDRERRKSLAYLREAIRGAERE